MAKKISHQPQKIIQRARRQQYQQQVQAQSAPKYEVPTGEYVEGLGRRKAATARVRIYESQDTKFIINDQLAKEYFNHIPFAVKTYNFPFALTGTKDKFAVTVKVSGSGIRAQLNAVVHGLVRALIKYDPAFKLLLKEEGLVIRDPRMKETRKPGRGGKARRKRQSPKR